MTKEKLIRYAIPVLIPAILLGILVLGSGRIDAGHDQEASARLEASLRRAIAAEYAVSGSYPEDLAGIMEHYGIQADPDRFMVVYTPVAENIPPDLTVLDLRIQTGGSADG